MEAEGWGQESIRKAIATLGLTPSTTSQTLSSIQQAGKSKKSFGCSSDIMMCIALCVCPATAVDLHASQCCCFQNQASFVCKCEEMMQVLFLVPMLLLASQATGKWAALGMESGSCEESYMHQ
eukprot:1155266-Pelagomonas_calceolata.AAC.1